MARPRRTEPVVRKSLEFPRRFVDQVERLQRESGAASFTEVLRRAVEAYDLIRQGATVTLDTAEGPVRVAFPEFSKGEE